MAKGKENTPRIGIFGRCNAGKSTLMNFITGAQTAIVAPEAGTTTDPVRVSYEIAGFGPVVLTDTAGLDDPSQTGAQRIARTEEESRRMDAAVIIFRRWGGDEERLKAMFSQKGVPVIALRNIFGRHDVVDNAYADISINLAAPDDGTHETLVRLIAERMPARSLEAVKMFPGMLRRGDHVVLVCPIDAGAPAGRMILPQMQALREILDAGAVAHAVQPAQLGDALPKGVHPHMVVCDSQVYKEVRQAVDPAVEVTTFSILLAAAKGDPEAYAEGLKAAEALKDGDSVLVVEFCSHQTSCDDIARVRIPAWLEAYAGCRLEFVYAAPSEPLPGDPGQFALAIICGGCMATPAAIRGRIAQLKEAGTPVTNFGMLIKKIR